MTSSLHLFFRTAGRLVLFLGAAVLVRAQPSATTPYSFTTLAGAASIGSNDGPSATARFNYPTGITVDTTGNLYVSDTGNHTIRKITPAGVVTTLAGKAGYSIVPDHSGSRGDGTGSAARFTDPGGLTVDAAGNVYVAGGGDNAIRKVTAAGVVTTVAGGGAVSTFNVPEGVTLDPAGNLYVADTFNLAIRKITPAGTVTTIAGGSFGHADGAGSAAQFFNPRGIAIDAAGNLYVADSGNSTIRKITPGGDVSTFAGRAGLTGWADGTGAAATFNLPCGLTIDAAGNLYVADTGNATVRKITPAGAVTTFAGVAEQRGHVDGAAGTARFFLPLAVVADPAGNLFVADTRDQTIRKITPAGTVSTVAGVSHFQSAGSTDGTAAARFFAPDGVAVGPGGEVYVADKGNHTIRKIAATGAVTTLAGLAGVAGFAEGTGAAARFDVPLAVAVDASGNIYVADSGNGVICKVTPAGTVSKVAGLPGQHLRLDSSVSTAQFNNPSGVAVDASGNIFVADGFAIRKVTPAGQVSTVYSDLVRDFSFFTDLAVDPAGNLYACNPQYQELLKITPSGAATNILPSRLYPYRVAIGPAGQLFITMYQESWVARLTTDGVLAGIGGQANADGSADGVGSDARFENPTGIAVDSAGNVYLACIGVDSNTIRKGQLAGPPVITVQPANQTVTAGATVQFAVTASGVPAPTYQWYFNGSPFNNATGSTLSFANAVATDAGDYTVVVTNELGTATSAKATLTVAAPPATPPPAPATGGGSIESWLVLSLLVLAVARPVASRRKTRATRQFFAR